MKLTYLVLNVLLLVLLAFVIYSVKRWKPLQMIYLGAYFWIKEYIINSQAFSYSKVTSGK